MSAKRAIVLKSGKKFELDLYKITAPEFRLATAKETDVTKSDEILAKSFNIKLKELQTLPFPDYQELVSAWWKSALEPIQDYKRLALDEDKVKTYGVEYGQMVIIVKPDEQQAPNSQSASTSD